MAGQLGPGKGKDFDNANAMGQGEFALLRILIESEELRSEAGHPWAFSV
jgi:hypothetical protein